MDFAAQLKEARNARGISQKELATRLNTNVTTLSRYETGQVKPNVEMAATLAKALDTSLDQLCGLAQPDSQLVILARKADKLSDQQQKALRVLLEGLLDR